MEDKAVLYGDKNADVTFVTWGSQKGPILDVIDLLAEEGIKANLLYVKMFIPFPANFVKDILSKAKIVIDVESNFLGQLAEVVMAKTGIKIENRILKYNGRHMTEDEILSASREIINNKETKVEKVLKHGA